MKSCAHTSDGDSYVPPPTEFLHTQIEKTNERAVMIKTVKSTKKPKGVLCLRITLCFCPLIYFLFVWNNYLMPAGNVFCTFCELRRCWDSPVLDSAGLVTQHYLILKKSFGLLVSDSQPHFYLFLSRQCFSPVFQTQHHRCWFILWIIQSMRPWLGFFFPLTRAPPFELH